MSNILVMGCGTQGLAIVRDLHKSGHVVYLVGERHNYADSSRYVTKFIYCKYLPSSKLYLTTIKQIIAEYHIESVIPMGDSTAEFLSRNKEELCKIVAFEIPDYNDFIRATDKNKLMSFCKEKGYPHPYTINSVGQDISKIERTSLQFPLLIKPNITCGARGMTLVQGYDELIEKYPSIYANYGDCHLQKYVKQGGAQVEVQLYVNRKKKLVNSSVIYKYRWYPEKGGSSCCAKSIKNEKIVDILYHLLCELNWVGFADFDTIEDPDTGELLIMELNPRVPACVKCPIVAGVQWGEIIANEYLGRPQKEYDYKDGEFLRHIGLECFWFVKSPNRFKTRPLWIKFLGKHIHYQDISDWTDPVPFWIGTFRNISKVLHHSEKGKIDR